MSTWIDGQLMLHPALSEEMKKQEAVLSYKYVPDLTLKAFIDFVDVNDPSIVKILYQNIS